VPALSPQQEKWHWIWGGNIFLGKMHAQKCHAHYHSQKIYARPRDPAVRKRDSREEEHETVRHLEGFYNLKILGRFP
jgi:hypothetical protein